jgi:hypothetical protein
MTVFWILLPLFAALGVYLVWYSSRARRLVEAFARARGLRYERRDDGQLAAALDSALGFEEEGLVRAFDRVQDIVHQGDSVALFRAVELLDLSPYGTAQSTHFSRVGVTFEVSGEHDVFVLVSPNLMIQSRLGSERAGPEKTVELIRSLFSERPPRCPLSITLKRGRGLVYLEPYVTGSVKAEDLDYLVVAGQSLRSAFN